MRKCKNFYKGTILEKGDLIDMNINHIVELKYYKTVFSNRISKIYGVEITKKEYKGDKVTIETERISNLSKNEEKVNTILEVLTNNKVTPMGLGDIINDMVC